MTHDITLPRCVYEKDLPELCSSLCLGEPLPGQVNIYLRKVQRYIPAAIVAVVSAIDYWKSRGVSIQFPDYRQCDALGYFQRMDFFDILGESIPEDFVRHPAGQRFVPVKLIPTSDGAVSTLATSIAGCVAPPR